MSRSARWVGLLLAVLVVRAAGNAIREAEEAERPVFDYRRNGVKINVRVVPSTNVTTTSRSGEDDGFPRFPFKEIGHCVMEFSLTCVQKRVARFLDIVGHLREITLFGQSVKLVRVKDLPAERVEERRMIAGPGESIDKSVDDFFDTFALRITLPRWKGKKNQIDVMMDDTDVVEGRGGKGGGGKGGGKGGKGGGKGGGCKKMMMMMMVGLKMKMMGMIGMAAMKGMIMGGMSLMISKMMILQKLMSMKGGFMGFGGGGGGGGGGGNYKEIVLLTKAASSASAGASAGGGGGGGYSAPSDSYGAPPPTGGGGGGGYDYSGGGGGGGWGRSFDRRPMPSVKEYTYHQLEQEPAVMIAQDIADEPLEIKSVSDKRWNREATWNYTTETPADQIKASQELDKRKTMQSSSFSRPIYAQSWKNYEISRPENSDYYSTYNNVKN